ncbi:MULTISPECIES: preprotein translocase subunit SecG [unclassified Thioalkalivibrio]|uniref:preprotein translocase subunit SecG n=1 Tax=unclassified Thioalkalivibrio TaxID=2621013 RepID=UPI00035E742A|nr:MULTISPECIES: preprotein translocase subunit SecG [unclassified Thioalkalivibrio]
MIYGLLLVVQVAVSIGLIALILMQHGKGADAGAAFGSGASATVFGAAGSANFLSRSTAVLAVVFFLNSLTLAFLAASSPEAESLLDQMEAMEEEGDGPPDLPREVIPGQDPAGDTPQSGRPADVPD